MSTDAALSSPNRPRLMPADTPDHMAAAWAGCMTFAIGHAATLAAFRAETKNQWEPGTTALERLIDKETDAERFFMEAFIAWANERLWGKMSGAVEAAGDEP
ncbi:MAG: hypothetical protein ACRYHQ_35795 [Janthinobacterium lividum]